MHGHILIVDDHADTANAVADLLRKRGYTTRVAFSGADCLEQIEQAQVDVVITDVKMEGMTGIELAHELSQRQPDLVTIVITGDAALETAVLAIRAGAFDYIAKPIRADVLNVAVQRAMLHVSLKRELHQLRDVAASSAPPDMIAGTSDGVRAMKDMISRVADSDATVLVTGESGTGKELVARSLHNRSARKHEPFVAINCGAMPAPLLESELFGHVRGAFTDAKETRSGLFVQAGAGTIFLDEIGELPLEMQAKLLRVLQERRVRPVGGDTEVPLRARVVAATNRTLEREVEERRFREDLFYRINVVQIPVPALRHRPSDILPLAQYFLVRIAKRIHKAVEAISAPAARKLLEYDWPGNIRELENCIERAVALCRLSEITTDDLPERILGKRKGKVMLSIDTPAALITIDEMGRQYVRQVLAMMNGNKTHAARLLGIDRRSLYRRLEDPKGEAEVAPPPETDPPDGDSGDTDAF